MTQHHDLWSILHQAAQTPPIDQALRDLYEQLDHEVQLRGPMCWASGRCCRFESYGHRLYVTALEIAWAMQQPDIQRLRDRYPDLSHTLHTPEAVTGHDGCPFQLNGLCGIHPIRPLGCRIFFCQKSDQDWQQPLYEQFLAELRTLHEIHDLPYQYLEWRTGLAEYGQMTQVHP